MPGLFTTFSIGKDQIVTIEIDNANSAVVLGATIKGFNAMDLGILERFHAQPIGDELKSTPATQGGVPVYRNIQSGWEGEFEFARTGMAGDLLQQLLQESYHGASGAVLVTINHTVFDPQGAAGGDAKFAYPKAILRMADAGEWRAEEKVIQKWTFKAPRRDLESVTAGLTDTENALLAAVGVAVATNLAASI